MRKIYTGFFPKYKLLKVKTLDNKNVFLRNCQSDFDRLVEYELGIYDCRSYEQYNNYLRKNSSKKKVFFDLGANIGLSSLKLLQHFNFDHLFAIEANKNSFDILRHNLEKVENCNVLNNFVTSDSSKKYIIDGKIIANGSEFGSLTYKESTDGGIDSITIDNLLANFSKDNLSIILKIDIEGSENSLFSKNTSFLNYTSIIFIELHDVFIPNIGNSMSFFNSLFKDGMNWDLILHGETLICFKNE